MIRHVVVPLSLLLLHGCALSTNEKERLSADSDETGNVQIPGTRSATVLFQKGEVTLNAANRKELNELALLAHRNGKEVGRFHVVAWADKEYPDKADRPKEADIRLAKKRAKTIKEFLRNDLNVQESVQTFNMAKQPGALSEALKSDEWAVKNAFKETGATATRLPNGQTSFTKASKAIVIIEYQDDEVR